MESKINKLTMREILKEIGFPLIKNDFRKDLLWKKEFQDIQVYWPLSVRQ